MPDIALEYGMPASPAAERTILGCLLLNADLLIETRSLIAPTDFSLTAHQRVFRAICDLYDQENTVDLVTLSEELRRRKEIESIGGVAWLSDLTTGIPRRMAIREYLEIVKDKSVLRQVINISSNAITRAADQSECSEGILQTVLADIETLIDGRTADDALASSFTVPTLDEFKRGRHLSRSPGFSFGLDKLDEETGGMRPGEVTVVGARSGVGKTALLMQMIVANCGEGIPVHIFSLEQKRSQILQLLWAKVSGVPFVKIRDPWKSSIDDEHKVTEAAATVASWPLRVHDKSEISLGEVLNLARLSIRRHGTKVIGVDYAQEMWTEAKDERTRVMKVASGLAKMIKHENASLMLLSQLRKVDRKYYNTPPTILDLSESGKLENVAHVVALLHRWYEDDGRLSTDAQVLIPKNRGGETGGFDAKFDRKIVQFYIEKENRLV